MEADTVIGQIALSLEEKYEEMVDVDADEIRADMERMQRLYTLTLPDIQFHEMRTLALMARGKQPKFGDEPGAESPTDDQEIPLPSLEDAGPIKNTHTLVDPDRHSANPETAPQPAD